MKQTNVLSWMVVLFVVALVAVSAGYLLGTNYPITSGNNSSNNQVFPSGVACQMDAKICPDGSSVGRTGANCEFSPCPGGATMTESTVELMVPGINQYADIANVFTVQFPTNLVADVTVDGLRLIQMGPTQREGTEVYDGFILTFTPVDLKGTTLAQYVENEFKNTTAQPGGVEIITPKESVKIREYAGFRYTVSQMGEYTHYFLQNNASSPYAVHVAVLLRDPSQQGFSANVATILDSLAILK